MADRVPVSIRIGGSLPPALLARFLDAVTSDGACSDWEGEPISLDDFDNALPLNLVATEVAWGRFEAIEAFCVEHRLVYARWAGGAPGAFGPERTVFDGAQVRTFAASDDDEVVVAASEVRSLGSYEAVLAYLAAAEAEIPAFTIDCSEGEAP